MAAVSGWVIGNVLTSLVAGVAALVVFVSLGMPYATLLALWVAVADLIPLAGATLGAIPAIVVGFLVSPLAGIVVTIFFVLYQQLENHVLQPAVYGRTIRLNPFFVLLAILVGIELAGFVGALLALPVAGIVQIVVLDVLETRQPQRFRRRDPCLRGPRGIDRDGRTILRTTSRLPPGVRSRLSRRRCRRDRGRMPGSPDSARAADRPRGVSKKATLYRNPTSRTSHR